MLACGCGDLERVVSRAGVAIGGRGDFLQHLIERGHADDGQRAAQQHHNFFVRERAQHVNLRARKQRGIDFERRILGGGADQNDVAALDVRQKGVLLGFVEAMDFVDEEDGAAAEFAQAFGIGHHGLDFLDAGSTALKGRNSLFVMRAMMRASVVLPTPGGPRG